MDEFRTYLVAARGRIAALATDLGITPGAVSQWRRVPAERVLDVERLTGVSRHELRPDLYPQSSLEGMAHATPTVSDAKASLA